MSHCFQKALCATEALVQAGIKPDIAMAMSRAGVGVNDIDQVSIINNNLARKVQVAKWELAGLKTLQDNIPGYQLLREPTSPPSRFSNYD